MTIFDDNSCDLTLDTWDTDYIADNWEQQYKQLLCDLWIKSDRDSICNSCDVLDRTPGILGFNKKETQRPKDQTHLDFKESLLFQTFSGCALWTLNVLKVIISLPFFEHWWEQNRFILIQKDQTGCSQWSTASWQYLKSILGFFNSILGTPTFPNLDEFLKTSKARRGSFPIHFFL